MNNESKNFYVSSRGLLKSCDFFSNTPHSSIKMLINYPSLNTINSYTVPTIYICSSAIPSFVNNLLPLINNNFILVSGDCDETIPNDIFTEEQFFEFINNEKLVHWFCQNMIAKHKKITTIPIGLDYHTMVNRDIWGPKTTCADQEKILNLIKQKSKHFSEREVKCYANFHFLMNTRYGHDRLDAYTNINKNLVYYEKNKETRIKCWNKQIKYGFVISPHGGGLDCHRTWEALILGCIPIVKTSKIDHLFDDLPVLIVNDWSELTQELLNETIKKFSNKTFNINKLTLEYWKKKINNI